MTQPDQTIEALVKPDDDDVGYVAIVLADGETIYNSKGSHNQSGVFPQRDEAQLHADYWAKYVRGMDAEVDRVRLERSAAYPAMASELFTQADADTDQENAMKKSAKACKDNADARIARVRSLARHAENPRIQITWDRKVPESVKYTLDASAWDDEFEPKVVADNRQLSLPRVTWGIVKDDNGAIKSVDGHGRVSVRIENGEIVVRLGADEHKIVAKLAAGAYYSPAEPTAAPVSAPADLKRGTLSEKNLRARIAHIERPETLLAIFVLESQHAKPRKKVLTTISALATDLDDGRLLDDLMRVEEGESDKTAFTPDLAAAALATSKGTPDAKILEQLVPACSDCVVLGWILDDEMERGEDARDAVVEVIRSRLGELQVTK